MNTLKIRNRAPWLGAVFVLLASLALVGCDNDMNITGPELPEWDSVWVSATLTAHEGGATEARLYYDGQQIGVKYDVCGLAARGCGDLKVQGFKEESPGLHTIEVRVMKQTAAEVTYRVAVEVRDSPGGPVKIRPAPVTRTLREGDSVTFEVNLP